MKCISDQ